MYENHHRWESETFSIAAGDSHVLYTVLLLLVAYVCAQKILICLINDLTWFDSRQFNWLTPAIQPARGHKGRASVLKDRTCYIIDIISTNRTDEWG